MNMDLENRRKHSIHNARFLDLANTQDREAAHEPWITKSINDDRNFSRVEDAFRAFDGRLLLLGQPGSGKSTSIEGLAETLLREAETNAEAPIPVLVNLSGFSLESGSRNSLFGRFGARAESASGDRFERWISAELARIPGVSQQQAVEWMRDENVAFLLDGLDEAGNREQRRELVKILNATLIQDYGDIPIVVCSRVDEYREIMGEQDSTLNLAGGVVLQDLGPEQIDAYLEAAQALSLKRALERDEQLLKMAKVPLMLSLMTLAYTGADADERLQAAEGEALSVTDRRHRLLEAYIRAVMQREERRRRQLAPAANVAEWVPDSKYAYSPKRVDRALGWLALRMSTRMRTEYAPTRLYSLLRRGIGADHDPRSIIVIALSWWVALMFGGAVIAFACGAPLGWEPFLFTFVASGLGAFLTTTIMLEPIVDTPETRAAQQSLNWAQKLAALVVLAWVMIGGTGAVTLLGAFGSALVPLHPVAGGMPLTMLSISFLAGLLAGVFAVIAKNSVSLKFAALSGVAIAVTVSWLLYTDAGSLGWLSGALVVGVVQACGWAFLDHIDYDDDAYKVPLLIFSIAIFLIGLGYLFADSHTWHDVLLVVPIAGALGAHLERGSTRADALLGSAVAGGLLGGAAGGLLVPAALGFGFACWLMYVHENTTTRVIRANKTASPADGTENVHSVSSRLTLELVARWLIGAITPIPWRFRRFEDYCVRALLLKRAESRRLAFVHRMVRDHFALRDIRPRLESDEKKVRIGAIEELAFQGDAGVEILTDFSKSQDRSITIAALRSLAQIASPDAGPPILMAMRHPVLKVRAEAVWMAEHKRLSPLNIACHGDEPPAWLLDKNPPMRQALLFAIVSSLVIRPDWQHNRPNLYDWPTEQFPGQLRQVFWRALSTKEQGEHFVSVLERALDDDLVHLNHARAALLLYAVGNLQISAAASVNRRWLDRSWRHYHYYPICQTSLWVAERLCDTGAVPVIADFIAHGLETTTLLRDAWHALAAIIGRDEAIREIRRRVGSRRWKRYQNQFR